MDWNADSSEFDVFISKDRRGKAKFLRDVTSHGAYGHLLCSSLHFTLCYKAVAFHFREKSNSGASDYEHLEAEGKEFGTVEKPPVFEIETTELH